jgi:hypothetical protein
MQRHAVCGAPIRGRTTANSVILKSQHEHVFDVAARWFSPTKCLPPAPPYRRLWSGAMPPGIPDRLRKAAVFLHSVDLQRLERRSLGFRQPIVEPTCAGNRLLQLATRSRAATRRRPLAFVRSFLFAREGFLLAPLVSLGARNIAGVICLPAGALDGDVGEAHSHTYDCLDGDNDRKFRSVLAVFEQACREILSHVLGFL